VAGFGWLHPVIDHRAADVSSRDRPDELAVVNDRQPRICFSAITVAAIVA
jgi:hypothetical protein